MNQILTTVIAQVKAGNRSEILLNEILQIINFYKKKKLLKKCRII